MSRDSVADESLPPLKKDSIPFRIPGTAIAHNTSNHSQCQQADLVTRRSIVTDGKLEFVLGDKVLFVFLCFIIVTLVIDKSQLVI